MTSRRNARRPELGLGIRVPVSAEASRRRRALANDRRGRSVPRSTTRAPMTWSHAGKWRSSAGIWSLG